ncbi:MAG: sugar phosphate isomerase/epimerase [Saprospiraceae bacterium]
MKPLSSHQSGITFENADKIIADVKAVGFKYLVIPIPPMGNFTYDQEKKRMGMKGGVDNLAKTLNILGKKCKEAGLKLLYHNHDFELRENEEGVIPLQYLLENTEPEWVNFEMDLYWTIKGGADPLAYFEKYPGRFKIWHVKDMDDQGRFAPVGQGNIDFGKILAQKDKAGMKYYFVEQDQTYDGLEPLEAIKVSFEGLGKIGF